jgi:hypothetical protein
MVPTMRCHIKHTDAKSGHSSLDLTNAFSKKWENLKAAYALWFAYYNLCRVHQTLRVTPAMEAGITGRIWNIGELLKQSEDIVTAPVRARVLSAFRLPVS